MKTFKDLMNDDGGATAIEYGLIAALVSVAIITILGTLGDNLNNTFSTVSNSLGGAAEEAAGDGDGDAGGGATP